MMMMMMMMSRFCCCCCCCEEVVVVAMNRIQSVTHCHDATYTLTRYDIQHSTADHSLINIHTHIHTYMSCTCKYINDYFITSSHLCITVYAWFYIYLYFAKYRQNTKYNNRTTERMTHPLLYLLYFLMFFFATCYRLMIIEHYIPSVHCTTVRSSLSS